ncbi:unnamed protein product [Closterium sp. NIES-54]
MASLRVLAFGHEGRPLKFDTWLDDLQLYLLSDSRDSVLLFDHKSGAAPTPPATADSATHSQWLTRDAAARLAICNHLPLAECAHFGQHRTAQALYDAVVARYSSPATAALGRLLLPYLCPELSAFATVEDLGPLSLSLDPTVLTLDLLEQHLLAAKTIAVAVGAARGTPRTPFFEGCSPSPLAPSYASAAAIDVLGTEDVRAASASAKCRSSKGKGGRGGGGGSGSGGGGSNGGSGGGGSGGSGGASGGLGGGGGGSGGSGSSGSGGTGGGRTGAQRGGSGGGQRQRQQHRSETPSPQQLHEWLFQRGASEGAEGDYYRCVPPDPDIEAAALGASDSSLPGNAPAEALPTFTLDSVVACSSTVLPCPAIPSSSLSGLHLPSSSMNLVSTAALQDSMVTTTTPGGQRVSICTCTPTGRHLATFTRQPGSSMYKLATEPPRVATSAQMSASLPPLPPLPAPPCLPCVEGRHRAAPHSSSFPPTSSPLQTLHMEVWDPARVSGQGRERYFLLVNDDYTRYTTVFPLRTKGQVVDVLIPWIRAVRLQLRERFHQDLPLLRLHSNRGGEFSSDLLPDLCRGEGILQSFTLPTSPQQNGIAERHIGLVVEVARTSMIHEVAPHFMWPFAVGDASVFRVWGSRAFARDMSADKLSARTISCVFVGFPPDAPRWQFYHPTSRCVFPSQDVTFDESVPFYRLFPYRSAPPPPPPLFLAPGPPPVDPLLPQGVASAGAEPGGAESEGAGSGGAESGDAEPGGVEPGVAEPEGVEPEGAESGGAEPQGAASSRDTGARGAGVTVGAGGTGGTGAAGPGGARIGGTEAAETGGVGGAGAEDPTEPGAAGAGGTGAGGTCAGAEGAGAEGTGAGGAVGAGAGGTVRPRLFFVPLLQQVLGDPSSPSLTPPLLCSLTDQSQLPFQPASPLPAPSPYTELSSGLTEHREPASRPVLPVRTARRVPRLRPPHVLGMHNMVLCPSSVPLRVPLPPPESSLPTVPDPESDLVRAASPTVSCILSTVVTDPSFESTTSSALVAELLDFAASCRLEYATALVAESESTSPPSVGGECALCTDVLEDRQEDFECLAAAVPCFASMPLAPEGDPDAPDIPTPRSYAEAITANIIDGMWIFRVKRPPGSPPAFKARYVARGFSQRQGVDYFQTFSPTPNMTTLWGSLHEGIWLRRPPGFTESFHACTHWSLSWPVYGLRLAPRGWHDTLRTTLAALGFAPSTADPLLFLRIDTSPLPLYILVYIDDLVFATAHTEALTLVKSELHKRHTCTDLGELRSYLGLQITRDRARRTITLTQSHMVHQVLQHFGFQFSSPQPTPLSTSHSLSAPPSDESIELSGPYLELVGCLMYVMTCTRPDLAYPLSLLARYVAPSRHRKVHWDAAKRVLRYLCSTSGMGLLLGGRGPVVLTGQADASWVDDSATQRSSQSYNFTLGYGFVSWRSTRSSSVLSSSCEAEIYAGAMAALVLRWLTYLLTDLGEQPRSPPFPYVDNKAMIALCQEHRLEHRMKHIALRYFLARELQQRGQLRLAYVATRANTADIFTKALPPGDHQRFSTMLGLVPTLPHLLTE